MHTVLEQADLHEYNVAILWIINLISFINCQNAAFSRTHDKRIKKSVEIQILFPIVNVYGYKSEM